VRTVLWDVEALKVSSAHRLAKSGHEGAIDAERLALVQSPRVYVLGSLKFHCEPQMFF